MKSEKTNKLAPHVGKRSSFKTKRGIKIHKDRFVAKLSGNNLAKFQPNWSSGCWLVVNPLHTKGVVFISYKNENVNKDACHAYYLQQNPTDP